MQKALGLLLGGFAQRVDPVQARTDDDEQNIKNNSNDKWRDKFIHVRLMPENLDVAQIRMRRILLLCGFSLLQKFLDDQEQAQAHENPKRGPKATIQADELHFQRPRQWENERDDRHNDNNGDEPHKPREHADRRVHDQMVYPRANGHRLSSAKKSRD